jgi:phage-related protein
MQSAMNFVKTGLDALGDKAKSAMKKLKNAFDKTADDAKNAGKKVGNGFKDGMKGGLNEAPSIASKAVSQVNAKLMSGATAAFAAGAFISQGFAKGMLSCLSVVQSAASRIAAAADKAIRAKAKIHSPSKVSTKLGQYWGGGYAGGISDMAKDVWNAAQQLVSIPQVATPNLAMAYSGELSEDLDYYRNSEYVIEVPLSVDGKEFARATATYTQEELDKRQTRESRKKGKV